MNEWAPHDIEDVTPVSAGQKKTVTFSIPAGRIVKLLVLGWLNEDSVAHTMFLRIKPLTSAEFVNLAQSNIAATSVGYAAPPTLAFVGDLDFPLELTGPLEIQLVDDTLLVDGGPVMAPVYINWVEKGGPADNGIVPTSAVT